MVFPFLLFFRRSTSTKPGRTWSTGSYEQSPRMMNMNEFRHHENLDTEFSSLGPVESQLREDLADAMRESPLIATGKDTAGNHAGSGASCGGSGMGGNVGQPSQQHHPSSVANQHALTSATGLSPDSGASGRNVYPGGGITIAKVVNPLGTVTTISTVGGGSAGPESIDSDEFMQECVESYLHENCDEALFRPVVTVHHDSVSAGNLPAQELDMVEMRSGRYRGSSLDRTAGGGGVETAGKGRLMAGGCEERPLSQPASLIGRDLIVPVIEEKNMPYFTSSGANKQHAKHLTGSEVTPRSDVQGELTVEQVPARKLSNKKDTQETSKTGKLSKDTGEDSKGSELEKDLTSKHNVSDPSKVYEEFETIELPVAENDPLEKVSKMTKKEMKTVLRAESQSVTSAGSKKSKEKKVPLQFDAPSTGSASSERNERKDFGNVRGNGAQEKKNTSIANVGSEKRSNKRTANSQKVHSKDNRKEKESSIETKRTVAPPVLDTDQLLPPLEALKIDDLELFGDDVVHDAPPLQSTESDIVKAVATASSNNRSTDAIGDAAKSVKANEEINSGEASEATLRDVQLVLDTYYDPMASDSKYEVLEFVEQTHDCSGYSEPRDGSAGAAHDEKTLISFESPLMEEATVGGDLLGDEKALGVTQQKQMVVDMESVFAGGNIMLAMCSSLREASPSTDAEVADRCGEVEPSGDGSSSQGVPKQHSLEGQDSDYKSLELDMDIQSTSGEMGNMSTSYNPTTTDTTTTIVSLLSSASEDDEDVTTNSTNNDQEEEAVGTDDALLEVKDTDAVHKTSEPSGKRRRRKRTITCQNNTPSTTINMAATLDTKDDDGDEEEDNGEEDDEELQPLISSNKTSSSSLSAPATKDSLTYGEGPPLTGGSEPSALLTSLPTESEPTVEVTELTGSVHVKHTTQDESSVGAAKCSTANSGLSTSLLASSITGKTAASGIAAAGGGNGGNGKKKSKKKRK
uniref:Uncharacterized protein n=1 Tax=Anopheles culicifacies TaxID=139723 RepID=A0A182MUE3_9DIPT